MYGFWWLVIVFGILVVVGFCLLLIDKVRSASASCLLFCVPMLSFLMFLFVATVCPLVAEEEYKEFVNTSIMVEQVYSSDKTLENFGLTQKVFELNNWLTSVRGSVETFGNWSMYYNLDLDSIDYIVLNTSEV